jgi:hypothetical protein
LKSLFGFRLLKETNNDNFMTLFAADQSTLPGTSRRRRVGKSMFAGPQSFGERDGRVRAPVPCMRKVAKTIRESCFKQ